MKVLKYFVSSYAYNFFFFFRKIQLPVPAEGIGVFHMIPFEFVPFLSCLITVYLTTGFSVKSERYHILQVFNLFLTYPV